MSPNLQPAMHFAPLLLLVAATVANALDFSQSSWIWTNEVTTPGGTAPVGSRAFRKTFTPPLGKTPATANIIITVDNGYTLYVNGAEVGVGADFHDAEQYCVALDSCLNVFAVTGVNAGGPAALLVAIEVLYTDGTTSTLVSDTTWRYDVAVPTGYEQLSYDDNSWTPAISQGAYGIAPWDTIAIPSNPPVLSLTNSFWIWTDEVSGGNAPPGSRAFRRTYTPPIGSTPTLAKVVIAADNEYTLYIGGVLIGSGTTFSTAQTYLVPLTSQLNENVVLAVEATNTLTTANPAGLIAAVEIISMDITCGCNSSALFETDARWVYDTSVPAGFEQPAFDDSAWPAAVTEVAYGGAPWNTVSYSP
ncbi:hypothetical protein HMN09_00096700 [Mycena chlorophos]|uniref:Uncharacterized protein n=1 Tax=Mycena chlorophos TaxID=658473 RepID=A0A8H6WQA9_MYCCL|nr:hypothetical protein HMN09_00096700 [Mycena chlorophos]